MGKGSRNRQIHLQDKMENPTKYPVKKKKKQQWHAPQWLGRVIGLVLVAAILVGAIAGIVSSTGIVKRNRVLIESETGKFDINQNIATYVAWQNLYYNYYYDYLYRQYGISEDKEGILKLYGSADQYALVAAQVSVTEALRDCVDSVLKTLTVYVAVCDEAYKEGYRLEDEDMKSVEEGLAQLESMQTSYGYVSLKAFLKASMGAGMTKSDIKDALKIIALYNKYCTAKQNGFEKAVTPQDLTKYLSDNPEDFYKIDYLTFAADDEDFAKELEKCTTAEEFKALVLKHHLDTNYKPIYNKYTTTATANKEYESVKGKTNANGKTALTEALDAIGAEVPENYTAASKDQLPAKVMEWLISKDLTKDDTSDRAANNTTLLATDDGVYLVAVMSVSEDKKTVSARYKFYEFVDGDAYDTDTNFKKNIFEYIEQSKADEPSYPEVTYKKAKDKADAFEKLLKDAKGDEIKTILLNHQATNKLDITSTSTVSSTLPKVVRDKATASTVKAGDILNVKDGNVYYVIYVSDITNGKTDISFVSFESDLYFKIIEDLTETLDKVYPTEKTANYKAPKEGDTTVDTFEEWISELTDKTKFTSARAEHDAKYFKVEKTEDKITTTTYNAYIIVNTPMYLEEEMVVKGGYLLLKDTTKDGAVTESKADKVAKALETLKNKTDIDLLNALYAFDSSATVSESIAADSITDENLKAWLFAKERTQNEIASFDNKAGDGTYVAIFNETLMSWQSAAKSALVNEQLEAWMDEISAKYTPNERNMNKLGDPTPTTESTADTNSESEPETQA